MFFTLKTSAMERGKRGHKMDHKLLKYMSKKNADMGEARVVENPEKNAAVFDGPIGQRELNCLVLSAYYSA